MTPRNFARAVLLASLGSNAMLVAVDVAGRHWRAAALQSCMLVLLSAWYWLAPRVEQWFAQRHAVLDAQIAEAVTHQKMAEAVLEEYHRQQREGRVHFSVGVEPTPKRNVN